VPALSAIDPDDPAALAATATLRRECTEAKEALSADTEVTIPVLTPEIRSQVRLVRAEFEDMIRQPLAETLQALRRALRSADLTPADLDVVLLVGGSSRVPLVAQLVSAELGRPVAIDADPKAAIALGAALSALPADTTVGTAPTTDEPAPGEVPDEAPTLLTGTDESVLAHPSEPTRPSLPAIPLGAESAEHQLRRARTRRVTQVVLAGALALFTAAGVVSIPFLTSRSGPIPPANAGTPTSEAPVAPGEASPEANPPASNAPPANGGSYEGGSLSGRSGAGVRVTSPAGPNKPAGGTPHPGTGPVSTRASQPNWVTSYTQTTSRPAPSSQSSTTKTPTQPPTVPPTAPSATTKESLPPAPTTTAAPSATSSASP
ncbi:MAG: Hsp70 family protein, partial [Gemmatimonadales bacterium]